MNITATVDSMAMTSTLEALAAQYPAAASRALNRSVLSARALGARSVAQDMGLKVADAKERLLQFDSTPDSLEARLVASRKRLSLIELGAKGPVPSRGKGRGVTYRAGGSLRRIPNAFIVTLDGGHVGVFTRVGRDRLPIKERFGPSVGKVFAKFFDLMRARGIEQFGKNFRSELNYLLRSRRAA